MSSKVTPLKLMHRVKKRLANKKRWVQGSYALGPRRQTVPYSSHSNAIKWCLSGACRCEVGRETNWHAYESISPGIDLFNPMLSALAQSQVITDFCKRDNLSPRDPSAIVIVFNDDKDTTHADIKLAISQAVEILEAQEA